MKSELENLPNRVLYRILMKYMEEMYSKNINPSNRYEGIEIMSKILKTHGISNDFYDLNFMWEALTLNYQELADNKNNFFDLKKPEIKNWTIVAKLTGRAYYTEYSAMDIESYTKPTTSDLYDGDYNYSPYDGSFYDYEINDHEGTDWEIEDVSESTPKIKKNNNIQNENHKKNDLPNFDSLDLFELIRLKEQIEKQIVSKLSILI